MRKRLENSWRQANSQGIWRKFGAKTESNMVKKLPRGRDGNVASRVWAIIVLLRLLAI